MITSSQPLILAISTRFFRCKFLGLRSPGTLAVRYFIIMALSSPAAAASACAYIGGMARRLGWAQCQELLRAASALPRLTWKLSPRLLMPRGGLAPFLSLPPSSSVGSNEVFDENPTTALVVPCPPLPSFPLGPESLHHAACACDQKLGSPRSNCGRQRITSRIVTSVMMTMKISGQELPSHHVSILPAFAASSVHHSTRGTLSMRRGATLFDLLHLL